MEGRARLIPMWCSWTGVRGGSLSGGVLRRLPDDIAGVLVVPQALEPRVAQLPVGRPFAEAHLGDQAGLDPVHTGPRQLAAVERGTILLQAGQRRMQAVQRSLAEAGADLSGVDELAGGVVVAQQQRAEPGAAPARVGEAADDEFLAGFALELQPVPGPAGPVGGVGALGDDPLPAAGARLPEIGLAVGVLVLGEAQRVGEGQQAAQDLLALPQWQRADVAAIGPQHVEDVEPDRHLGEQVRPGLADAQALLQPGEPGLAAVEGDDLAVDDEIAGLLGGQGPGELGVGTGVVLLIAGHQPNRPSGSERQAPLAIQLALEDPPRIGEPVPGECGQLRIQPARLIRPGGRRCGSHGFSDGSEWPGRARRRGTTRPPRRTTCQSGNGTGRPRTSLEDTQLLT